MKPEELTIEILEKACGNPVDRWQGNCAYLAHHACNLVGGHEIYGIYNGPIDPDGYWGDTGAVRSMARHGWVLLEDGRILDPTRWSFENAEPYIYIGDNNEEYDEGGNDFRASAYGIRPCPPAEGNPITLELENFEADMIEHLTQTPIAQVTRSQTFWLANLHYGLLESQGATGPVYNALVRNHMGAFIPVDNRRRAEREGRIQAEAESESA